MGFFGVSTFLCNLIDSFRVFGENLMLVFWIGYTFFINLLF